MADLEELPEYLRDAPPRGLFTRLQRVALHLRRLQDESVASIGLSFRDFSLIATLRRENADDGVPVSRLAQLVLRPMGSITQVTDRLERAGLLRRRLDPGDRRKVFVELTNKGVKVAESGAETYDRVHLRVLAGLPSDAVDEIDRAITRLLHLLEANQAAPPRTSRP